jgi:predicted nucleic acid-binding protein
MIILDTNVLSEMVQPRPAEHVVAWLDKQARSSIWITSVTIFEIRFGLQLLPVGRKRSHVTVALEAVLADEIGGRVAPFDTSAAEYSAELMASRHKRGRPVELRDTMIAGIVLARHASLATRNITHFEGLSVPVVNPWALET